MSRHAILPAIRTDPCNHPAVAAWSQSGSACTTPSAVTPLKAQLKAGHKSGVYRLHGAGPGGVDVIAKRSRRSTAAVERAVYDEVLPGLPLPTLRRYGSVAEAEGDFDWLFLEDAGDESYREQEYGLVVEWLGRLQTAAAALAGTVPLPKHGHERYLAHLRSGRREILAHRDKDHLTADDREVLARLQSILDMLELKWRGIEQLCRAMPVTLVHGDFVRKNLRSRRDDDTVSGVRLFALDWETAGWGIPAADLAGLSTCFAPQDPTASGAGDPGSSPEIVDRYISAVAPIWRCTRRDAETWAHLGLLFRLLASIEWASYSLPYAPALKSRAQLAEYEPSLRWLLELLGWKD
jgi:phosphotransferase family enzyme